MHTSARHVSAIALALGSLTASVTAHASGLEIPDNGTVAFGRAGAFVTRASDATAVIHNVAALVGLPGVQIHIGTNVGFLHHCFRREGNYPDENETSILNDGTVFQGSTYSNGMTPYPQVCNNFNASVTPSLAVSYRISRRVAVGFAAWGPNTSGTPQIFPDQVTLMNGQLAPSPVRYMVYEKQLLMVYLQLAASFAITPWLRIGASLQPAYATFRFRTMSNSVPTSAQSPNSDLSIDLNAHGWLLAGQVATQILPSPYFSLGAQLRMNPEVHLQGTGDVVAQVYHTMASEQERSQFIVDRMTVPLPWSVRAGARFSLPRVGRPHNIDPNYDPMTDDVFDLEATFAWEGTSRMSHVLLENRGLISIGGLQTPAPATVPMDSDFRDVYGFRIGGDVNIVPGRFTVRAGFAYDTAAEQSQLAQIHLPGYETYSVHGGASVRFGPITANVGYAHVFMGGLDASSSAPQPGTRGVTSVGGAVTMQQCEGSAGIGACQINRGVYSGALDLLSVSLNARF